MSTELQMLPLLKLELSQTAAQKERRKHFDQAAIAELAESIKTVGMLAPIVARRVPDERFPEHGYFEIVAGERRYLAAEKAGLQAVPVSVRELTDEQVLEVQLVENLQREDLHELAEAEGYEGLLKLGYTAEQIADKCGKSKATVYARMKLLALCKDARKAFYEGKLNSSTALLLARIPVEQLQKQALKEITTPRYSGEVMSVREASRHIHDNYMLRLGGAGFKTEDASLVPAAGACGPCPKRTGNHLELFGDVKGADVCTDPLCFKAKLAAHAARAITEAKERGQKVISGPEAKKIAPYGAESSLQGFVRLDGRDYSDTKNRTYRQLLGKGFEPTLLQDHQSGKLVEVAPIAAVKKAAPARALNPQSAQEKKAKLESAYRTELFKQIRAASMARSTKLLRSELEEAALRLFERLDHDTKKRLFKALDWTLEKTGRNGGMNFDLPTDLTEMTEAELAQFMRDCTLAPDLYAPTWSTSKPQYLEDAAADLKIDTKKIRLAVSAEKKKPVKTAKPAPTKASKKKTARTASSQRRRALRSICARSSAREQ